MSLLKSVCVWKLDAHVCSSVMDAHIAHPSSGLAVDKTLMRFFDNHDRSEGNPDIMPVLQTAGTLLHSLFSPTKSSQMYSENVTRVSGPRFR